MCAHIYIYIYIYTHTYTYICIIPNSECFRAGEEEANSGRAQPRAVTNPACVSACTPLQRPENFRPLMLVKHKGVRHK